MKNQYIITGVITIVVGAAAFYGGMQYQQSKTPVVGMFRNGTGPNNVMQRGVNQNVMRQNRFQIGEIIKTDDQSITVKYSDGSSKLIILSPSTSINTSNEGTKGDLQPGSKVFIMGTPNSDGSETALNIQINPTSRNMNK